MVPNTNLFCIYFIVYVFIFTFRWIGVNEIVNWNLSGFSLKGKYAYKWFTFHNNFKEYEL